MRQRGTDGCDGTDGGKVLDTVVNQIRDIDGDVSTVALGPSVLPQITSNLSYFVHLTIVAGTMILSVLSDLLREQRLFYAYIPSILSG